MPLGKLRFSDWLEPHTDSPIHLRTMRSDVMSGEGWGIVFNRFFKFLLVDFQDLSLRTALR